jgi:hypothetical protein
VRYQAVAFADSTIWSWPFTSIKKEKTAHSRAARKSSVGSDSLIDALLVP